MIVVIGAGIIGVTLAWRLINEGHEVALLDAAEAPSSKTSFANGGQISACDAAPWAEPSMPWLAMMWMLRRNPPFRWYPHSLNIDQIAWLIRFLRNCNQKQYQRALIDNLALSLYSRQCLFDIIGQQNSITSDHFQKRGILHLLWNRHDQIKAEAHHDVLAAFDEPVEILTPMQARDYEPILAKPPFTKLHGCLLAAQDTSSDAHLFARNLFDKALDYGLIFKPNSTVIDFDYQRRGQSHHIDAVVTTTERLQADAVILCAGVASTKLARRLNLNIPVYPIKGYSLTATSSAAEAMPIASLTDTERRLVISRLDHRRLRIAGMADLDGDHQDLRPARCKALMGGFKTLFPDLDIDDQPQFWSGLRPMTPDGLPIIGPARQGTRHFDNMFLNTGHGSLGWTLACGSATLISDLIAERKPAIELSPFALARFAASR